MVPEPQPDEHGTARWLGRAIVMLLALLAVGGVVFWMSEVR